jgi:hypothetical protein
MFDDGNNIIFSDDDDLHEDNDYKTFTRLAVATTAMFQPKLCRSNKECGQQLVQQPNVISRKGWHGLRSDLFREKSSASDQNAILTFGGLACLQKVMLSNIFL